MIRLLVTIYLIILAILVIILIMLSSSSIPIEEQQLPPAAKMDRMLRKCGSAIIIHEDGNMSCLYIDWQKEEIKKYGKTNIFKRKEM